MGAGDEGGQPRAAAGLNMETLGKSGAYRIGIYAGTFDPIHFGHLDVIKRAAKVVDKLVLAVVGSNNDKTKLFSRDERMEMIHETTAALRVDMAIDVRPFDTLIIKFAREVGANVLIRGLRAVTDFDYEYQMAGMNQRMAPDIESVFLMADAQYQAIASKLVKEIARLEGDVSGFVPPEVERRLKGKFG
jgi:pantetheine-phosphate adenylyltransferase